MSARRILVDGAPVAVENVAPSVAREGTRWTVGLPNRSVVATVVRDRDVVWVSIDGEVYRCTAADDARAGGAAGGVRSPKVTAPMPGKVLAVRVEVGQEVTAGDPLVVLEAMKMETIVTAEAAARVTKVAVASGDLVDQGQALVELRFD